MAEEVVYTLKFVEEFVINTLKTHPERTNEQIAQEFIEEHGEKYDQYLRSVGAEVQKNYGDEISTLNGMKDKLKQDFIKTLQKLGILPQDENDKRLQLLKNYIKNTKLDFTFAGGGLGGSATENFVTVDWIQNYKYITEYPTRKFSFSNMAICTAFHELAHRLSFFLGVPTKIRRYGAPYDAEESFAQGVEKVISSCLCIRDDYTTYYKAKEKEIKKITKLRKRVQLIIVEIYTKTRKSNLNVLSQRCFNLNFIYSDTDYRYESRRIESYADPLSKDEIKAIVQAGLSNIKIE